MKKVLILGITGGFGGHVAQALAQHGWALKVLMREPAKLPARFRGAEVVKGDATKIEDVRAAANDVTLMVYGVNPRDYDWEGTVIPWLDVSATVAEERKLCLIFPGNVYVLDPDDGPVFDESAAIKPLTRKGEIRQAMEARLQRAANNGAQVIILRVGDFIGENALSTWMRQLVKPSKSGFVLNAPGKSDILHTWAYLPDVAKTAAMLANKKDSLAAFNVFHVKGFRITFEDLAREIQMVTGKPVSIQPFPWWFVYLAAPFSTMFRGLLEMRYLWKFEVSLDDAKLRKTLAVIPSTSLGQALVESGVLKK